MLNFEPLWGLRECSDTMVINQAGKAGSDVRGRISPSLLSLSLSLSLSPSLSFQIIRRRWTALWIYWIRREIRAPSQRRPYAERHLICQPESRREFPSRALKLEISFRKGASIMYVSKFFWFFDPLPLHKLAAYLYYKMHATSLTMHTFPLPLPPLMCTYFINDP